MQLQQSPHLVSVIIPCFNHGHYLAQAIESVLAQSYGCYEIIVVDDGSTDNSRQVAESYQMVQYVYQENKGLSSARNTGVKFSKGKFLVFLDSDDWLFPKALDINVQHLLNNKEAAFVSGGHQKVNEVGNILHDGQWDVQANHYEKLLEGNYIGMIATVMYHRWVFDSFEYDRSLKVCEDYDLYLKVARRYPVIHHQEIIAAYRIHSLNISGNIPLMLTTSLQIIQRHKKTLQSKAERASYIKGLKSWKSNYCAQLSYTLLSKPGFALHNNDLSTLRKYSPKLYFKTLVRKSFMTFKKLLKRVLLGRKVPAPGRVQMGNFNRTTPFSTSFGYDRGGPVDRYYIENFLKESEASIHGTVLEIGDNDYTVRFGGARVKKSEILHVDQQNAKATYIGDLSDAPVLPDNHFDTIILTQTLHLIYQFDNAIQTCYRVLKPGGVLLLTVPGISHIDQGEWKDNWLWSFTGASINRILSEVFPTENIVVETHGNVLVAAAFLFGMGLPEIKKEQMDFHDPHYQVIITGKAIKPE